MKLTLQQLKKWKPCGDYIDRFKKLYGRSVEMKVVEKQLLKDKDWSGLDFIIEKRLQKLDRRQICKFAYLSANRSLQYAYKKDVKVLSHAISFAKQYAETGKVDVEAARSAAWSAESAARSAESAESAARSAARSASWSAAYKKEYIWQLRTLSKIEERY